MVAPERKQKGDGVGEAESVWDLKIHSFHKQWNDYHVPNAKCVAAKPAPATPAANYCLAGALRTVAHGRTDGRTEGRTCRRLLRTGQTTPLRRPDLEASVRRCKISAGPALPPLGGPHAGPARASVGGGTYGLRALRVSNRPNRGVSFPASQSHRERFKETPLGIKISFRPGAKRRPRQISPADRRRGAAARGPGSAAAGRGGVPSGAGQGGAGPARRGRPRREGRDLPGASRAPAPPPPRALARSLACSRRGKRCAGSKMERRRREGARGGVRACACACAPGRG